MVEGWGLRDEGLDLVATKAVQPRLRDHVPHNDVWFRIEGSGFRVDGSGFSDLGFRVQGLGFWGWV